MGLGESVVFGNDGLRLGQRSDRRLVGKSIDFDPPPPHRAVHYLLKIKEILTNDE